MNSLIPRKMERDSANSSRSQSGSRMNRIVEVKDMKMCENANKVQLCEKRTYTQQ